MFIYQSVFFVFSIFLRLCGLVQLGGPKQPAGTAVTNTGGWTYLCSDIPLFFDRIFYISSTCMPSTIRWPKNINRKSISFRILAFLAF